MAILWFLMKSILTEVRIIVDHVRYMMYAIISRNACVRKVMFISIGITISFILTFVVFTKMDCYIEEMISPQPQVIPRLDQLKFYTYGSSPSNRDLIVLLIPDIFPTLTI